MKTLKITHCKLFIVALLLMTRATFADITATVYPGYQFSANERPTVDTLNRLGSPTIVVSGTLGGTNVALAAGSVTGTMLSGTVVDGVTVDFNASTPRAIEVMTQGIHTNNIDTNDFAGPLSGGFDQRVHLSYDNVTLRTNGSGQLYVSGVTGTNTIALTNLPPVTNGFYGADTNGVVTNLTFSSQLRITNGVLYLNSFTTTNINLTAQNSFNLVIAHGLGATPLAVRWVLVCVTGEAGYAIGDEVDLLSTKDSSIDGPHFTVGANATNVFLTARGQDSIQVYNFSTGTQATITLADWKLKCYARP